MFPFKETSVNEILRRDSPAVLRQWGRASGKSKVKGATWISLEHSRREKRFLTGYLEKEEVVSHPPVPVRTGNGYKEYNETKD